MNLTPATAYTLHRRGVRAIQCYCWQRGSYLRLSDSQPIRYTVHGVARGIKRPSVSDRDHVADLPSYQAYFDEPVWVAVRVEE